MACSFFLRLECVCVVGVVGSGSGDRRSIESAGGRSGLTPRRGVLSVLRRHAVEVGILAAGGAVQVEFMASRRRGCWRDSSCKGLQQSSVTVDGARRALYRRQYRHSRWGRVCSKSGGGGCLVKVAVRPSECACSTPNRPISQPCD